MKVSAFKRKLFEFIRGLFLFKYVSERKEENTGLSFDGEKIVVSPDVFHVFNFLMEIEKEVESLIGFSQKLKNLSKIYLDMTDFAQFLAKVIKENGLDFKYNFAENPVEKVKEFNLHIPLRSQFIVLFVSIDVLFNLHSAYENKTCNEKVLRSLTMHKGRSKKFFNEYILNVRNEYYHKNKSRLSKINAKKLRKLRNSLTHFFSIGPSGISLMPDHFSDEARRVETILEREKIDVTFVSVDDLYGLIKEANKIRIKNWNDDCRANPVLFGEKMRFVIDLVKNEGAKIVPVNDLKNIK